MTKKIESFLATHNGIKPLIPRQRVNTRDPEIRNPALKGGEGVIKMAEKSEEKKSAKEESKRRDVVNKHMIHFLIQIFIFTLDKYEVS